MSVDSGLVGEENPWFTEGSLHTLGNSASPHPPQPRGVKAASMPLLWEPWSNEDEGAPGPKYVMNWVRAPVT